MKLLVQMLVNFLLNIIPYDACNRDFNACSIGLNNNKCNGHCQGCENFGCKYEKIYDATVDFIIRKNNENIKKDYLEKSNALEL